MCGGYVCVQAARVCRNIVKGRCMMDDGACIMGHNTKQQSLRGWGLQACCANNGLWRDMFFCSGCYNKILFFRHLMVFNGRGCGRGFFRRNWIGNCHAYGWLLSEPCETVYCSMHCAWSKKNFSQKNWFTSVGLLDIRSPLFSYVTYQWVQKSACENILA